MKTNSRIRFSLRMVPLLVAALGLLPGTGRALNDISQIKLFGHWANPSATNYFTGLSSALNEKWAVMGAYNAAEPGFSEGGVQVFSAVTGAWVRKILPPLPVDLSATFGYSTALSGDLLAVGSYGTNSFTGVVYIYNLSTGALLRTLTVAGGVAGDQLGFSLAISGQRLLAGAIGYNGNRGAVYVFDLGTGAQLGRIDLGGSGVASDKFGSAVAAEGRLALIGAPGVSLDKGAGYLFNIDTLQLVSTFAPGSLVAGDKAGHRAVAIHGGRVFLGAPFRAAGKGAVFCGRKYDTITGITEITASDGAAGDTFGFSLSADAGMLLVGAPGVSSNTGAAYLYDVGALGTGATQVRKIQPSDAQAGQVTGVYVRLCGNSALIASDGDATQGTGMGAGYLMRPLITPMSALTKVAAKGDFAPGAPDTTFNVLGDPTINGPGQVAFSSTLTGLGSNANTDIGAWTNLRTIPSTLQLVYKSRGLVASTGNQVIQSVSPPLMNERNHLILPVTMKVGTGSPAVTATTTKWFLDLENTGTVTFYGRNGATTGLASFGAAQVLKFGETVQGDADFQNYWGNAVTLTPSPGVVTAATDSGVITRNSLVATGLREGVDTIPGGGALYGQFTGRLALFFNAYTTSAATTGPVATNQIVVSSFVGSAPYKCFQKGDPAPEAVGVAPTFSAFLGETMDGGDNTLVRATVIGGSPAVTSANNEGIWQCDTAGNRRQVLRKGQTIGSTGLKIAKIINVWGAQLNFGAANTRALTLVQLASAAPGIVVSTANDLALILAQEGNSGAAPNIDILMREGDPALGCGTGTIGTINRVNVDAYCGGYLILATLAGAPVGTELALYAGRLMTPTYNAAGNASNASIVRRPSLFLRKGWRYDGQPSKIKSIYLPSSNLTASGFGSTGRQNNIAYFNNIAITVEFDNGIKQIMSGSIP